MTLKSSVVLQADLSTLGYNNLLNYQAVIDDTSKALELSPAYVKALNRRAAAYEKTGQNEQVPTPSLTQQSLTLSFV